MRPSRRIFLVFRADFSLRFEQNNPVFLMLAILKVAEVAVTVAETGEVAARSERQS